MEKKDPKDYSKIKIVIMFIRRYYPDLYDKTRTWICDNKRFFKKNNRKFFECFSELAFYLNRHDANLITSQYYSFIVKKFHINCRRRERLYND